MKVASYNPLWARISTLVSIMLIAGARWFFPERSFEYTGLQALMDVFFALGLLGVVLLLALSLGVKVLRFFGLASQYLSEQAFVFGLPLGMGILAYGILALGFLGVLSPGMILLLLALVAVFTWREWGSILTQLPGWLLLGIRTWSRLGYGKKLLLLVCTVILFIALLQALSPAWDYDGLMYHLEGPRIFLEHNRLIASTSRWWINMPLKIEMLFTIGISFGSDIFPKLLHLSFSLFLVAATFVFARHLISSSSGYWAIFVLLGIPILPRWASYSNIDFGWAMFELAGVFSLFLWFRSLNSRWLVLSGLFNGFALGTKYLALVSPIAMVVILLFTHQKQPFKVLIRRLTVFILPTLLVASPWYLKNLLWLGDPVFPFLIGGNLLDPVRMESFSIYSEALGRINNFVDWLTLSVKLYTSPAEFSEILPSMSFPSLVFPLLLLYPLTRRDRSVTVLFVYVLTRFLLWSVTARGMRYLLPIYPFMSIGTVYIIKEFCEREFINRTIAKVSQWVVVGMVILSFSFHVFLLLTENPIHALLGIESKDQYLQRMISTYSAVLYARQTLPEDSVLLSTGDGRTYYCPDICYQSDDQFLWLSLLNSSSDAYAFEYQMKHYGFTHLLISQNDIDFFVQRDQTGRIQKASEFLFNEVIPLCGKQIYSDQSASIYSIICY